MAQLPAPYPFYRLQPDFETIQIHAGQRADPGTHARAVPIFATAGYVFDNVEDGAQAFSMRNGGYVYSRFMNPTVEVLEKRVAALEGGLAAVAASSGLAAQLLTISSLCNAGDNIVASAYLYGGTINQLSVTFQRFGISCKFIPSDNPSDFEKAIDDKTKAIYVETIPNPRFIVSPIKELSEIAHRHAIPLVVDNTLGMGGYLCRPIEHGADIVVESATKWLGGQGTTLGGVIVDSGKFDWNSSGKFPGITTPSVGHHGIVYTETFGVVAFAAKVRIEMLRDMGPCLSPFAAFQILLGTETLSLRCERHCQNAMSLAIYLEQHPKVQSVSYPGLESHASHARAKQLLRPSMFGGVLTFAVHGGEEVADRVLNNLKLASHLANLGEARTLVIRPSATTQCMQVSEDLRDVSGVPGNLIRVSVGLESIRDIIADFESALQLAISG